LFTTLIHVILVPYLQITIVGMKIDTLFEHKEVISIYEKSMDNANDKWKLFKPPPKPKR